jgi:hypothetical protein
MSRARCDRCSQVLADGARLDSRCQCVGCLQCPAPVHLVGCKYAADGSDSHIQVLTSEHDLGSHGLVSREHAHSQPPLGLTWFQCEEAARAREVLP